MADGYRLKSINISGFRGYGSTPETIDISDTAVIFAGGNRSGKSSTLNAVEWALYGDEVVGLGKVKIEERKGWLVKNRGCERARVELTLGSNDGELKVYRSSAGGRSKKARDFYFIDENGERHEEEGDLWNRLGLGPKDFMSSAYLHQEVIRDLLVTQPSVRKEALDRLLGVSDLRNLFDAFKGVRVSSYDTAIAEIYAGLEDFIELRTTSYREALAEKKENGEGLGIEKSDYMLEGFKKRCGESVDRLAGLAKKAGVEPASISLPSKADGFKEFADKVSKEIDRLRVENPGARSRQKLDGERRRLDAALSKLLGAKGAVKDLQNEKRDIEKEHGTRKDLERRKKVLEGDIAKWSAELAQIGDRINVVNETIEYLEHLEDQTSKASCPSCGRDILPAKLLEELNRLKEETREQTEDLEQNKGAARKEIKLLERFNKRLSEITSDEFPEARATLSEAISGLGETLGKKVRKDEDPEVLVESRLKAIGKEIEKNKKLLAKYTEGLAEAEEFLDAAESVAAVLALEKKIKKLNAVTRSPEWTAMNKARERLNKQIGYVEKVKVAVEEVLGKVSRQKVSEARGRIADIYKKLVERPDFDEIEIDPDRDYEVFAVSGGEREKLITFFNQGDMNCAALAIFLALGTGRSSGDGGVNFLMLDDPSQSLDSVQKERLAQVLDEVTGSTQVVVSTMDNELLENARKSISRKKKVYVLGAWDPEKGPKIGEA